MASTPMAARLTRSKRRATAHRKVDWEALRSEARARNDYHAWARTYWRGKPPPGCHYDPAAAEYIILFLETYCIQSKGAWAGQPIKLLWWQQCVLAALFGWIGADGYRQFRTCYIEIPKKNGKSTLCSALTLALLFADDEPGAEVYMAAASKEQAKIVFREAKNMLLSSPELLADAEVYKDSLAVPGTMSRALPIGADADLQDGINASGIIFDELHRQPNRFLYDVLLFSTAARRQPLMICITTAGYSRESICWEQHERSIATIRDPLIEPTHLGVIYAAEEGDDWTQPTTWHKANPSLGETLSEAYLQSVCDNAKRQPGLQNAFKRLHLDLWTSQETRWLDMALWDACKESDDVDLTDRECYGGLDLASTIDMASFGLVFPPVEPGEPYRMRVWYWIPGNNIEERVKRDRVDYDFWRQLGLLEATPGNVIDYNRILAAICGEYDAAGNLVTPGLMHQYRILEVGYDPWRSAQLATAMDAAGLTTVAMRQGVPTMGEPTQEFGRMLAGGELAHNGNPILRWNADNVMVVSDDKGNIVPSKKRSREKIDGIVAQIMALGRALVNKTEEGSIYDERGIIEIDDD